MNFFAPSFLLYWGDYHGYSCQIPEFHRGKKVLATIRDPMDYYISCYINGFGLTSASRKGQWWWRKAYCEIEENAKTFDKPRVGGTQKEVPHFEKFLHFINSDRFLKYHFLKKWGCLPPQSSIGFLTCLYIQYFFKNAADVFSKNDEELNSYFKSGEYKKDMYDVTFLNTKNLNKELRDFLLNEEKISPKYIDFILSHPNVETTLLVGVQTYNYKYKHSVESLRNELTAYIKEKDRFYCRYFLTTSLDCSAGE